METVVFLPGYLAPPAGFRSLAGALRPHQTLELGRHPSPAGALEAWRGQVPPNAHLAAFAEAAWPAAQLAAETQARSLILFSPILRADAALKSRLEALRLAHQNGQFAQAATPWMFGAFFLEQGQEPIAYWAEEVGSLAVGEWLGALHGLGDGRKHLRRLECPVLVVAGAEDAFTPLRYAQEVVDWTPLNPNGLGAVRVSMEGCGHLAPWENPLEAANLLEGFVTGADSVGGSSPRLELNVSRGQRGATEDGENSSR
ncbi:MAG: alpha/beta hydrolase [Meiothermus sp.]|nr:alpha/beta hydrolase [Meiothermus sp.]